MTGKSALQLLVNETRRMVVQCGERVSAGVRENVFERICERYASLRHRERYEYVRDVASLHNYTHDRINSLLYLRDTSSEALRVRRLYTMKESLQPRYRDFFINLGRVPNGIKLLVDLRSDIMDIQQKSINKSELSVRLIHSESSLTTARGNQFDYDIGNSPPSSSHTRISGSHSTDSDEDIEQLLNQLSTPESASNLYVLNKELKDLITVWFSGGICKLERITWDSPCRLLQKISELEAVHPVKGWVDIKRRVGPYRRCYVFTHLCMPNEPIVILHTALCSEIPSSIRDIVTRKFTKPHELEHQIEDPTKIRSAIFYSISSPYKGLSGVDLGNTLIKRVVEQLKFEFPNIKEFSTLSPVPGFRKWLSGEIQNCLSQEVSSRILGKDAKEKNHFSRVLSSNQIQILIKYFNTSTLKDLLTILDIHLESICSKYGSSGNLLDLERNTGKDFLILSWFLKNAAVKYLCLEKYRGYALDSVCNFHLKNGAVLWRINWLADPSPRGIQNSYGVMVNYRYFLENSDKFSENYLENRKVEVSDDVKKLLDELELPEIG